jgi:hypothetical protein
MKTRINRFLAVACLLAATALPGVCAAQDDVAAHDRTQTKRKLAGKLFTGAYATFGLRLRTAATLQACNKGSAANAIDVAASEEAAFLVGEMKQLRASDSRYAISLDALSTAESIKLISSVNDQLGAYKLGYREAVSAIRDRFPAVCEDGMQSAGKILKERK